MEKQKNAGQTSGNCCCEGITKDVKESTMKSSIRDKAEGTFHEVKGAIKEAAGKLTDNPKLKAEGTVEKIAGKVQEKVGQVKQVFGK
jgi:uncharacterized protein YjbJ (UPF0337 family)